MHCRHVQAKLSAYIDEEMPLPEQAVVTAHLAQCEACRAELAALRRTTSLARDLGAFQAPPALAFRLDPALIAARAAQPEPVSWAARVRGWIPVLGPAGALAMAAMAFVIWRPTETPGTTAARSNPPANVAAGNTAGPEVLAPGVVVDGSRDTTPGPTGVRPEGRTPEPPAPKLTQVATAPGSARVRPPGLEPVRDTPEPAPRVRRPRRVHQPAPAKPQQDQMARMVAEARSLIEQGRYDRAKPVIDAALQRAWTSLPAEQRADYEYRNAEANTDIDMCTLALSGDPANTKAREIRERAYTTKFGLLLALAG